MLAEQATELREVPPVATVPRLFSTEEIGWLANEARILRAFSGHGVWIDDPDLGPGPFRRLAYHPRLAAAVSALTGCALSVERTTMLYARRGIVSPSAPYWRAGQPGRTGDRPLAAVFLDEAEISLPDGGEGRFHRIGGTAGDVAVLSSEGGGLTATTDGHLAPLLLVTFGSGLRLHGGRPVAPPRLAEDCLWQPAFWAAG